MTEFSLQHLQRILASEVSMLSDAAAATYALHAVEPFVAWRKLGSEREPTFVVAQAGSEVLYYDDVEEEFGTATIDGGTLWLSDVGTWGGGLEWALHHFPASSN